MVSSGLANTIVTLRQGRAFVDVAAILPENNVVVNETSTRLMKPGLYEFDAGAAVVRVFEGKARVLQNGSMREISSSHEFKMNSAHPRNLIRPPTKMISIDGRASARPMSRTRMWMPRDDMFSSPICQTRGVARGGIGTLGMTPSHSSPAMGYSTAHSDLDFTRHDVSGELLISAIGEAGIILVLVIGPIPLQVLMDLEPTRVRYAVRR